MKVAFVHDWLTGMRGGERILESFLELFPGADIFTLIHNKGSVSEVIETRRIKTSFIQWLPKAPINYRSYLPLFPIAIEGFDLRRYDLVISSSHCVAKGVGTRQRACHICYCYTPMRYAWLFFDEYFGSQNIFVKKLISMWLWDLRRWDLATNKRVDYFIAISENVKNRIKQFYKRTADVIYPPLDTETFNFDVSIKSDDFYLIASAFVPYKRIDIAIEAFNILKLPLTVVGNGPCEKELKDKAKSNITFMNWLEPKILKDYYTRCKALIFPGEEDFGLVPLEAQACGRPVIAYAKGGVLETVVPINPVENLKFKVQSTNSPTGVFFYEQTPQAIVDAVRYFEITKGRFNKEAIRQNVLRFNKQDFKIKIKNFISEKFFLKTGKNLNA